MRVLQVLPVISVRMGGPAINAVEMSKALSGIGVESEIWTSNIGTAPNAVSRARLSTDDLPEGAREVRIRAFPARPPHRFMYCPALGRHLAREIRTFDVVHIHSLFLYPQFTAYRHALDAGVPYIVAPCGALDPNLRYRSPRAKRVTEFAWQRRMMNRAAFLHYKTPEEMLLASDIGYTAACRIVPNGLDWSSFQQLPNPAEFRSRYLNGHSGAVILNHGRLSHKKSLDVLIEAFAVVQRTRSDAKLVIVGPDDEGLGADLRLLADKLGVLDDVVFTGLLTGADRLGALAAADVWALPSTTENFGTAVLEALAVGLPAVLTPEINLTSSALESSACVVTPRSAQDFAAAISSLLDDQERRDTLGVAARRFARRYDWCVIAEQLRDAYTDALSTGSSGTPRRANT